MTLLIVGNPGSFSSDISNSLLEDYKLELIEINKDFDIYQNIFPIKNKLKKNIYKFLIYLGGETRNEKLMKKYNQYFLIKIGELCNKYGVHLIYLGTLAVFGIPNNNLITRKSTRKPFNLYGKTKNEADIYLMNNSYKIHIFNLLPASIKNNSRKNFYNKIKVILRKPYFKLFFFFFCPGGQFSFCSYYDITKEIKNSINYIKNCSRVKGSDSIFYHEKIISKEIKFKDIYYAANRFYPLFTLPSLSIKLIKFCFSFLSQKLLLRIIFLYSLTRYKNESF